MQIARGGSRSARRYDYVCLRARAVHFSPGAALVVCQFGFFKPTYANTSVFWAPLPVEKISAYCAMIFGIPNMQPNTENTNSYYGGYDLQASNVLFTNGLLGTPVPGCICIRFIPHYACLFVYALPQTRGICCPSRRTRLRRSSRTCRL